MTIREALKEVKDDQLAFVLWQMCEALGIEIDHDTGDTPSKLYDQRGSER